MTPADRKARFVALIGEIYELFVAEPAADILVSPDTVGEHIPDATARWFADGCRAGKWPSSKAGRKRVARLSDVLAAIAAPTKAPKPVATVPAREPDAVDRALARGTLRVVGGAR